MMKLMPMDSKKAGMPPGTVVHIGNRLVENSTITVMDYNAEVLAEHTVPDAAECKEFLESPTVTWINAAGLHDVALLQRFGTAFGIHPLVMEDIANTNQRPKLEDHGDYLFMVVKMLYRRGDQDGIVAEQVSLILGPNYLITFQEMEGDTFDLIRERIRGGKGRVRKMGCDYLAYSLIDSIVDNYFVILEEFAERIEAIQEEVLHSQDSSLLVRIQRQRGELLLLRKNLWPLRELVSGMEKSESGLLLDSLRPYLRDVYEHTIQVIDSVESIRELLSVAVEIYMSCMSNRMNQVMKVLTVIATIFIPLTFVAGVYGMNFRHMPELEWRYGYAAVWVLMLALGIGMGVFFRKRRWL